MKEQLFHEYFSEWMDTYKRGYVRNITFQKYEMTLKRLKQLAPQLKICELNKRTYQNLINEYAKTHERKTVMNFHHQLKSAILDAIDERLIETDFTRKTVVKGVLQKTKRQKFLSQQELKELLRHLDLSYLYKTYSPNLGIHTGKEYKGANWDWFILLIAKTGLRFSEALGLTPNDFDFENNRIKVSKTWNYKSKTDNVFDETKNVCSKRTIPIDEQLSQQFQQLISVNITDNDKPIFVTGRVFNSTINDRLEYLCNKACIPIITVHSLRHTHASLLLYAGVSISSIAGRLGHANTTTTQDTYLHIVKELENRDKDKVLEHLSAL